MRPRSPGDGNRAHNRAGAGRPELRDLDERLGRYGGLAELRVEGCSLVDELIADRRAEAAGENDV